MPEPTTAVAKVDKEMVYVPFGGKEEIKLSISLVKNLIAVKTKSGATCSDDDAIKFLMMCKARLLNPFEGDAFLIGYDSQKGPTFSLITAHQAFLKRAELNPEYDGMESGVIVEVAEGKLKDLPGDFHTKDQKVVGGWAVVYFKNRKFPMSKRVRLARFQKAFGVWQDDPAGMIVKCAEADALRSSFPTMLGGLYLKEETEHDKPVVASAPIFSSPAAEEVIPEAEVVPEPTKAPVASTAPPVVPVPKPKAPKAPEPVKTPPAAVQEPQKPLILHSIHQRLIEKQVTVDQIIKFLIDMGNISDNTQTLEEVALENPDVLEMLHNQFDDIVERIKGNP
jgi:phage recombination protein Bet